MVDDNRTLGFIVLTFNGQILSDKQYFKGASCSKKSSKMPVKVCVHSLEHRLKNKGSKTLFSL